MMAVLLVQIQAALPLPVLTLVRAALALVNKDFALAACKTNLTAMQDV